MQLLIIFLNREDFLDDILSELVELEVTLTTIIEGVAMERILAKDVPIFAGLLQSTRGSRAYNKNIFALLPQEKTVQKLVDVLRDLEIDLTDPSVGTLFTLPIDFILSSKSSSMS